MEVNREGVGARPGAGRRPVHAAREVHPLSPAGDRLHRHGRGDLQGADEHQPGPADGQGPRWVHEQPDERDLGLAGGLRQHAAGPVPERRADAGADPGLQAVGGPPGPGRPLGRREVLPKVGNARSTRWRRASPRPWPRTWRRCGATWWRPWSRRRGRCRSSAPGWATASARTSTASPQSVDQPPRRPLRPPRRGPGDRPGRRRPGPARPARRRRPPGRGHPRSDRGRR